MIFLHFELSSEPRLTIARLVSVSVSVAYRAVPASLYFPLFCLRMLMTTLSESRASSHRFPFVHACVSCVITSAHLFLDGSDLGMDV